MAKQLNVDLKFKFWVTLNIVSFCKVAPFNVK